MTGPTTAAAQNWEDAHEITSNHLIRATGLADALIDLIREFPAFSTNCRAAGAIRTVAEALAEAAAAGADAHGDEHVAAMKLARFGAGNV